MRRLLMVIDKNGKEKIDHFINTDTEFEREIAFLTDFIADKDKLRRLKETTARASIFTPRESADFSARLLKGYKKDTEYYLYFLDSEIGVELLDNLIESKLKEFKFYPVSYRDALFVEDLYEINFKENLLKIYKRGELLETKRFEV